jgi:hypothetical protein
MRIICYFFVAISYFLYSCTDKEKNDKDLPLITIEVIDTLKIKHSGKLVKIIDYNTHNGNYLLCDIALINKVIVADSSGRIKKIIRLEGEGPDEPGTAIHNIGYADSTIVVNSNRGFFFYNEEGLLQKKITESTPLMGYGAGTIPRLKFIQEEKSKLVILHLKSSVEGDMFTKSSYHTYNPITVYDLESKKISLFGGYNPESIFIKDWIHFGDPINIFNMDSQSVYSINNPEPVIYVYSQKNLRSVAKKILLTPQYFKLPVQYTLGENVREDRAELFLNSQFIDINSNDDMTLVSYRSGIPESEYSRNSQNNLPNLFKKYMKYYLVVIKNGKKFAKDTELPYGSSGVAVLKKDNSIILNTNAALTETPKETIFYKARIKQ